MLICDEGFSNLLLLCSCISVLLSSKRVGFCASKQMRLHAGCSHHLHSGNWDGVRGVHPGQHAAARYHCQQGDQWAAPYRTEGVQEPLGGEEGKLDPFDIHGLAGRRILTTGLKVFSTEQFRIGKPSDVIGVMYFLCTYLTHSLREQPAESREDKEGKAVPHWSFRNLPPIQFNPY